MTYYIAQGIGLIASAGGLFFTQFKKKWQILVASVIINFLCIVNVVLLSQWNTASTMTFLVIVQLLLSLWHDRKGIPFPSWEQAIFIVLFVIFGVLGYREPADIFPLLSSVFFCLSVFPKREQHMRLFLLGDAICWIVYYAILGSTLLLGQIGSLISILIALWRYREKNGCSDFGGRK